MDWFNIYGLVIMIIMMIPNAIYAKKIGEEGFINLWINKAVETLEQIGRVGCFLLMVINIPYTYFGFISDNGLYIYLGVNGALLFLYCLIWIICFRKNTIFRSIALSVLPSLIFLFSGAILRSVVLFIAALIFAPCHITISLKNTILYNKKNN